MISITPLTWVTRRLNGLMKDWNDYTSHLSLEQMMNADSDQDKLKKLSEGIQNEVEAFLVSPPCGSSAQFQ